MHSFASALIAAALATLISAAPVGLPAASLAVSVSGPLSNHLASVPFHAGTIHSDKVKPVAVRARAATLSVAAIFANIQTETQLYTDQLTYLTPSNCTINEITDLVSSIKASITAAVPQLKALAGQEDSVILASVSGDAELSVSEVACTVGGDVNMFLGAAGAVLSVTNAKGGDIVADVKDVLTDFGCAVTSLVGVAISLVSDLSTSLAPVVAPVHSVVSDLDLDDLAIYLGLTIA